MKIAVLDAKTLGEDIDLSPFLEFGETRIFGKTDEDELDTNIGDADVVIFNKIKFNEKTVKNPESIKLVCVTATGFDNIDLEFCRKNNIAVCNIVGYSTDSVAQVTVATALALVNHILEYDEFSKSGKYSKSGSANRVTPVYHEVSGMTWGIVGCGNIGRKVLKVAEAFGAKTLVYKKTPDASLNCVDLDTLLKESDIVSVHTPLNDETRNLIDENKLSLMKKTAVLVNVSRGAVVSEEAVVKAIENGELGGFGADVFTKEPYPEDHVFVRLKDYKNVILTPHMAWGSYEARQRCIYEICKNIKSYISGGVRNRIEGK